MPDDLTGKILRGSYKIEKRLAQGGMGEIWQAHDRNLDRPVAIKTILQQHELTPDITDRFISEARAVAKLYHPHILMIHDFDSERELLEESFLYIVMPIAQGGSLADLLESGPVPLNKAEPIFRQICEAVAYAHSKGIIHRDLKPGNILFDETGYALVADFGVAKILTEATRAKATTGVGTLAYAPREQIFGGEIDRTADIFALGVILYEMLTGQLPERDREGNLVLDTQRLLPDVADIIEWATEHDPEVRCNWAEDLAEEFSAAMPFVPKKRDVEVWRDRWGSNPDTSYTATFSSDGRYLAVGGWFDHLPGNGPLWVLDTLYREEKWLSKERAFVEKKIALSPDGKTLAVVDHMTGKPQLWRVDTGKKTHTFDFTATDLAFSPDGRLLAIGSKQGAKIWKVGDEPQTLLHFDQADISSLAFSPDGRLLAMGSGQGTKIWQVGDDSHALLHLDQECTVSLAFSPDGQYLATSGETIRLWDMTRRETADRFQRDASELLFSPDGRILLSASKEHILHLRNLKTGKETPIEIKGWEEINTFAFNADSRLLAIGSKGTYDYEQASLYVWDVDSGCLVWREVWEDHVWSAIAVNHATKRLAVVTAYGMVLLYPFE